MSVSFAELKQKANTPLDPNAANVEAWTKKAESLLSGVREQMNSQHEKSLAWAYISFNVGTVS